MERTKTAGIYKTETGFDVDKHYRSERIRQCGFKSFKQAEAWLIEEMERTRLSKLTGQRAVRIFQDAAAFYLDKFQDKPSIVSDMYHLKAVIPHIGHLALDRIHNGTLAGFIQDRREQGRKAKTINLSLAAVRRILNLAARDWRDENGITWLSQAPLITMLPLNDQRPPRPIMWDEQRKLLPLLPDHLAEMVLFSLNCGVRDDVVCSLRWDWEVPVPQLGVSIFIVPPKHVKGEQGKKTEMVLVCNTVAQSVIERQRGKHPTHVFVWRRERVKYLSKAPEMDYRPITTMNNTAWQNGRKKAGLGDLHVHDLRHTVGLRLREANVEDRTQDAVLWHNNKSMTAHYSMAQILEIFEALEKIKDETNRWNVSLQSLIRDSIGKNFTDRLPPKKKTG